jgi:hypothetical protein
MRLLCRRKKELMFHGFWFRKLEQIFRASNTDTFEKCPQIIESPTLSRFDRLYDVFSDARNAIKKGYAQKSNQRANVFEFVLYWCACKTPTDIR